MSTAEATGDRPSTKASTKAARQIADARRSGVDQNMALLISGDVSRQSPPLDGRMSFQADVFDRVARTPTAENQRVSPF